MFVSVCVKYSIIVMYNLDVYVVYNLYEMGLFCMLLWFCVEKNTKILFFRVFPACVKKSIRMKSCESIERQIRLRDLAQLDQCADDPDGSSVVPAACRSST